MRNPPETETKYMKHAFSVGDLFVNPYTNTIWYIVDIDVAYLAVTYLNAVNMTGTEYMTKHYTEQSINDKRFIQYPAKQ